MGKILKDCETILFLIHLLILFAITYFFLYFIIPHLKKMVQGRYLLNNQRKSINNNTIIKEEYNNRITSIEI